MSSLKAVFTLLILGASLAANAFFAWQSWGGDRLPVTCSPCTVDKPVVMRTKGGLLEVSTLKALEQFEKSDIHTILRVPLGNTTARIRVPAVYRYHIELAPEWKIHLIDKTFIVVAPQVKPSLPVAIDTAQLQAQSTGPWVVFTGGPAINQLQRSITQELGKKAATPEYIQSQREVARKTVQEFVQKWLITQSEWKDVKDYPIRVFFSDEPIQTLGSARPPISLLH